MAACTLLVLCTGGCSSASPASRSAAAAPTTPRTSPATTTPATTTPATTTPATTIPATTIPATTSPPENEVLPGEPWILYQDFTTFERVFLVRPDGTGRHSPTLDVPGTHQTNPDWSPDGARIVFIVTELRTRTDDLWVAEADGANPQRLLDCQDPCLYIDDPSWSPDGRSIVFDRIVGGRGTSENTLEVLDLDTGAVTVLLGGDPTVGYAGARWSPDGRSIVVEVVQKVGPETTDEVSGVTLSVVSLDTVPPTVTPLTDPALFAATADWSPSGDVIVYSAKPAPEDEDADLFTIHPDGSGLTRLTNLVAGGGSAGEPTFTPDGSRIVFVARLAPDGDGALAVIDLDGSNLAPATADGYHRGRHPRVRPTS